MLSYWQFVITAIHHRPQHALGAFGHQQSFNASMTSNLLDWSGQNVDCFLADDASKAGNMVWLLFCVPKTKWWCVENKEMCAGLQRY